VHIGVYHLQTHTQTPVYENAFNSGSSTRQNQPNCVVRKKQKEEKKGTRSDGISAYCGEK